MNDTASPQTRRTGRHTENRFNLICEKTRSKRFGGIEESMKLKELKVTMIHIMSGLCHGDVVETRVKNVGGETI
jgi:hypothetical protein